MRYHDDNWSALCAPCHRRYTPAESNPGWWLWLRTVRLGPEAYERWEFQWRAGGKLTSSDIRLWMILAAARIEALTEGPRKVWARDRQVKINESLFSLGVTLP